MGRFEEVSIDWFVVGQDSNVDLSPTNGSLSFPQGNGEQAILITTIADEVCKIYFHHIASIHFFPASCRHASVSGDNGLCRVCQLSLKK